MLTVHKRGKRHADLLIGRIHAVRGSLGTRNEDAARRFKHKLEIALAEGCASSLWHELRTLLPRETFARFAVFVGVKEQPLPTWSDLRKVFLSLQNSESSLESLLSLRSRGTNTHSLSSNFSCPSERLPCYVTSAFRLSRNSRSGA